jgi:hypothetical protein
VTLCTKRATDGLQEPLYLALLLDPRPSMVAFVLKQDLLGDADNLTLGNSKAISAAKRAIMQIAEGVQIEGKAPREVGLALCKALHVYLGLCHLFIKHACLKCTMLVLRMFGKVRGSCTCAGAPGVWARCDRHQ